MNLRAVIVDDEPHAREGIQIRLKEYPNVKVVGESSSGPESVEMINTLKPDLLFLDIQMPGLNGFEVLQKINADSMPVVIFVTAYDKYAVKAFEYHALDYLLKPISDQRFREAMRIAISQLGRLNFERCADRLELLVSDYLRFSKEEPVLPQARSASNPVEFLSCLTIKLKGQVSIIPVHEIDWIESAGDYVYVHSNSRKLITRETLISLEQRMDPRKFVRVHRSAIVNVERIKSLKPNEHGDYEICLRSGDQLKLSRTYRKHFQKIIGSPI
jgi:two-component system LytT family response regulator